MTLPPGTIEAAARAAYESAIEAAGYSAEGQYGWESQCEVFRENWRMHARAAAREILASLDRGGMLAAHAAERRE